MDHLYSFYDAVGNDETFHIQCEWLNKTINLDDTSVSTATEYAYITVTDLSKYWHCTITHELLLDCFKVSNALSKEQRNQVLMAAFLGESSINESKLEWKVTHSEQDKLQLKLRTFDDDIAFVAGFISLNKAPENDNQKLLKLWFRNSTLASRRSTEINKSLQQRTIDIEKTNTELKQTIEKMIIRESKSKFALIDKFVNLLNQKKRKIFLIQNELKKRPRSQDDEPEEQKKKQLKTDSPPPAKDKGKEPIVQDEEEEDSDEDLLGITQTVR